MSDIEPVKIEFLYTGNTEEKGPKIEGSMANITAAAKKAQAEAKKAAADQSAVIKQIEADIKSLENKLSKSAPGNAQQALIKELNAAKRALNEEKAALDEVNASIENTAQKHVRLRTQVMELRDSLARLEMQGKSNTPEYRAMANELGRLQDQMGDTAMQARILADDQKGFRAVASGVSGAAGAMAAATGVAALFGAENEELARIQTRLQAVMAISIGLQQVSETLNKDSYFSVDLLTKAKGFWAAANLRVATTLGISTVAAKALMATITLGLSVAIVGLITMVDRLISKNKEQKKAAEDAAKAEREAAQSSAADYAKEVARIQSLRAALNSESVDRKRKLQIIDELKKIMPGYNAELSKEGVVIRENTTAVNEYMKAVEKSIKLKIEEKNLQDLYSEKYKIEQLQFQRPSRATDEALRAEDEFNAWKKAELDKFDKQESLIKDRINKGGLVSIVANNNEDKAGGSSKEAKEAYNAEEAITKLLLDIRDKRTQLEIAQQADSLKKRLAAIDFEKAQEIAKIAEKEAAIVAEYNKDRKGTKGFVAATSVADISPELATKLNAERDAINAAFREKEKSETEKYQAEITEIVMSFADERTQIAYNYNKDIEKARALGLTEWATDMEKEKQQRIDAVTTGMIAESDIYKLASDDKLQITRETTALLIDELQARVDAEVAAGRLSAEAGEKFIKQLSDARAKMGEKGNANNPFAQLSSAIQNKSAAQKAFKEAPVGTSTAELAKLEDAAAKATASTAAAAGAALMGVKDILGSVVGGLDRLGMLNDEQKKDAENIIGMVGGAADIAMGIATGNPMAIIQGSIDLIVNGFEFFDFKNKELEKKQRQHMQNVADLEKQYDKLQRAVNKALGTDIYKAQRDQIANQKKQIAEYEAWLRAESQKKKRKQDAAAIEDTKAKIEALKNSIDDQVQDISDSLAQTTVKDLASQLSDALVGAFQNGESAAEAMGAVVDNVLRNAVINALKLKVLDKLLAPAIDQFANDMESGGGLTGSEADRFRNSVTAAGEAYFKALNEANDALGGIFNGDASGPSAIKGDVAKMTEQTGSALVGQITGMRLNVAELLLTSRNSLESLSAILATLEDIRDNTAHLQRIDETLYYLKINGIKMN